MKKEEWPDNNTVQVLSQGTLSGDVRKVWKTSLQNSQYYVRWNKSKVHKSKMIQIF